jgi:predicted DNA-binding transcriptional regulator AlpA
MSKIKPCHLIAESYPTDKLIRYKKMCKLTGFNRITLYRWSNRPNQNDFIPPVRKNGRIIGWRESDYKKWLNR